MFDAVASLGAFEHFCSPDDYQAGRQEEIYRDLFARVSSLLPPGGRFYLQTMVFGPNMIPESPIDLSRDDQPVERADPSPELQKDAAQAPAAGALAHQR